MLGKLQAIVLFFHIVVVFQFGHIQELITFTITVPLRVLMSRRKCHVWSVLQLIHRVEIPMFYFKITLTMNHDIPKWSQYKNCFSDILLFIESKISIASHENNNLVNSRPETLYILVKHTINEQGTSKRLLKILSCHDALYDLTLTLRITNTLSSPA